MGSDIEEQKDIKAFSFAPLSTSCWVILYFETLHFKDLNECVISPYNELVGKLCFGGKLS